MQLLVWLSVCAGLSYAARRRPEACVVPVLVLWVLVPSVAGDVVTGRSTGSLSLHPATWLILATVAVQGLDHGRLVLSVVARHVYLFLTLALVVAVAGVTTLLGRTGGGIVLLVDQMVAPICLLLVIVVAARMSPTILSTLRTTLLVLAGVSAVLAITQWVAQDVLVYRSAYSTHSWFTRVGFDRWMATTDHPLTLSVLLCTVTPLAVGLRRAWVQLTLLALSAVAVVITQSRVGLAVIAVVLVYVVAKANARPGVKLVSAVVLVVAGSQVLRSGLSQGVAARLADDTGSAEARGAAVDFFAGTWWDYAVVGGGFTSSYGVAGAAGLETSLESSFLMYAVDIGLLFALLYFGAQALVLARGWGRATLPGLMPAGLLAASLPHTYSGLATGSLVGALLWTVLAMVLASAEVSAPDEDDAAAPDPSRAALIGGQRNVGETTAVRW